MEPGDYFAVGAIIAMVIAIICIIVFSPDVGERHGVCYGNNTCNVGLVCLRSDDRHECVKMEDVKFGPADGGTK